MTHQIICPTWSQLPLNAYWYLRETTSTNIDQVIWWENFLVLLLLYQSSMVILYKFMAGSLLMLLIPINSERVHICRLSRGEWYIWWGFWPMSLSEGKLWSKIPSKTTSPSLFSHVERSEATSVMTSSSRNHLLPSTRPFLSSGWPETQVISRKIIKQDTFKNH